MNFCLPKEFTGKFLDALRNGKLKPEELAAMSSAERRAALEPYVGKENVHDVNALLESKLLLKDQQRGLVTWAKTVAGLKPQQRATMIDRINKLDSVLNPADERAFLEDLAAEKIGANVTYEESKQLFDGAQRVQRLKDAIPPDSPIRSPERLAYGEALDQYHKYLNHLMGRDKGLTLQDFKDHPIGTPFFTLASATKGILASMDNSFFGRQGLKMLYTNPRMWADAFIKSWGDIAKELRGQDAMSLIRADILSRPNAVNGKYKAGDYAVGVDFEEEFPSHLPGKIPLLGRLYKASESAYNGAALRLRADYADKIIALAEKNGIDTLDPKQAEGLGSLVNSMTGRGHIVMAPKGPFSAQAINAAIFSVRFIKSNLDFLTAHRFDNSMPPATRAFVRKQAAANLLRVVGGTAAVLMTANLLSPGSVDFDPRSSQFGKIKIGNTTIDISGGMGALITMAARAATFSTKSAQTGKVTPLSSGKYGSKTVMDILNNFWEGRLSPIAGALRDYFNGTDYQGRPVTLGTTAQNLLVPIPFQNIQQSMNEPDMAARLTGIIGDMLGFSANPPNDLGVGLPANSPVQQELVRLGFTPYDFKVTTGSKELDGYMRDMLPTMTQNAIGGAMADPQYAGMSDEKKTLMLDLTRKAEMKAIASIVKGQHQDEWLKIKQEAKSNPRLNEYLKSIGEAPQ